MIKVIDIETTGTDPETCEIIEIASVGISRNGGTCSISNTQSTFVRPAGEIPPEASAVHHVIDADVSDAPDIGTATKTIFDADAYVAHNASFEQSFLGRYVGDKPWICTMKCALRAWPEAPRHSNQTLRYWLGLVEPFGVSRGSLAPHRALSDAIVTAAIFAKLIDVVSWRDMLAWSKEPALYTTLTFGKHRGVKYADAPEDYLSWIIDKSDLDADTKFSAQNALTLRRKGVAA